MIELNVEAKAIKFLEENAAIIFVNLKSANVYVIIIKNKYVCQLFCRFGGTEIKYEI